MTVKYYTFMDGRKIEAPYGVFSKKEMLALLRAKTAKGRPLGRNAIRYWLYVLCTSSGRKNQPYRLNRKELAVIGLSKSSAYEAIADLMHCGFFEAVSITDLSGEPEPQKRSVSHDYKLTIPKQSEISENKTPKQSEISDRNSPRSQTIVHKVLNQNQLPIIPLTPGRGWEGKSQDSNQPMSGIKGSIGYAIQEVIEKTPWLLAGSIYDSKKEITKVLLGTPADTLIKALVLNGEHSLLRTHGYHGSQRKRGVKMELECILDKLHKNVIFIPEWKEQENTDSFPSYPPLDHPDWYVKGEFEYVDNWDVSSFLPSLKSKMGSQFTIWIEPLDLKMVRLGACPYPNSDERNPFIVAVVQCPNRHFLEWVKENYTAQIRSTIPSHIEVVYVEREIKK